MADQVLPFEPSTPNYRVATTLGELVFIFDVRWNTRDAAWYLDIRSVDETLIAAGIKVVLGTLLGKRYTSPLLPDGILFAADLAGTGVDPGLDDLGDRVRVYFRPTEDL